MAKSNRYTFRHLENNIDRWFRARERIFLYHYRSDPTVDERWRDLSPLGCRYVGWLPLNSFTRGEIWLYPTQRHKIMIQMMVSSDQLVWKKEFMSMRRERTKRSKEYAHQMRLLRQKHGSFWFYE
jgi:hypothetical protein